MCTGQLVASLFSAHTEEVDPMVGGGLYLFMLDTIVMSVCVEEGGNIKRESKSTFK